MLTGSQVEAYKQDGYPKVEGLFTPGEVEELNSELYNPLVQCQPDKPMAKIGSDWLPCIGNATYRDGCQGTQQQNRCQRLKEAP